MFLSAVPFVVVLGMVPFESALLRSPTLVASYLIGFSIVCAVTALAQAVALIFGLQHWSQRREKRTMLNGISLAVTVLSLAFLSLIGAVGKLSVHAL